MADREEMRKRQADAVMERARSAGNVPIKRIVEAMKDLGETSVTLHGATITLTE